MTSTSTKRQKQITRRRQQIPRAYRKTYDTAVKGRSLRACVNAQCLECAGWQREEVRLCTDLACPLYAARPYQAESGKDSDSSQNGQIGRFISAESPGQLKGGS